MTCLGCELDDVAPRDALNPGVAGGSALRTYDAKHAAREDHARRRFGLLGVAGARLLAEPQTIRAWKKGAEGEERVGRRLEQLLEGSGVRLLHDRRWPGRRRANIDHLAVGPGGITVIDTKNVRGSVRVDRVGGLFIPRQDRLRIDGRERTSLATGVERQMDAVRGVVADDAIEVRGALCLADVRGLPLLRRLSANGVVVDGPRAIAKLACREGALAERDVDALARRLSRLLAPA